MSVGLIALGAILGAFASLVFGEWREARQRIWEKAGLARLLLAEVERNSPDRKKPSVVIKEVVDARGIRHEVVETYTEKPPMLDAWRETRTRLAQLLESQDFMALADYYQILQTLADNPSPSHVNPGEEKESQVWISEDQSWPERTEDLKKRLQRYADPPRRARLIGF